MNILWIRDTFTVNETLSKGRIVEVPVFLWDGIEQPRNHDLPGHSCIPAGEYVMVPHISGHLHEQDGVTPLHTWALVNAGLGVFHTLADATGYTGSYPVRTECLLHPANFARELEGCGAPGDSRLQMVNKTWMVTNSRYTFDHIRTILVIDTTGHTFTIQEN